MNTQRIYQNGFVLDNSLEVTVGIEAVYSRRYFGPVILIGQREEPLAHFRRIEYVPGTRRAALFVAEKQDNRGDFTRVKIILGAPASFVDDADRYEGVDGGTLIAWSGPEVLIDLYGD